MNRLLLTIDAISAWVGKAFGWAIVALTFAIAYEVASRYLLGRPTSWAYDVSYMLYGALFIMAGAYTLSRNGHVRGDVLYRFLKPTTQAGIDLVLYILFFFPGMIALLYSGWQFAELSWVMRERSSFSPAGPPLYHFKSLIPLAGFFLLLQGLAETARCILCLITGEWPQRLADVEELEKVILEEAQRQKEAQGGAP